MDFIFEILAGALITGTIFYGLKKFLENASGTKIKTLSSMIEKARNDLDRYWAMKKEQGKTTEKALRDIVRDELFKIGGLQSIADISYWQGKWDAYDPKMAIDKYWMNEGQKKFVQEEIQKGLKEEQIKFIRREIVKAQEVDKLLLHKLSVRIDDAIKFINKVSNDNLELSGKMDRLDKLVSNCLTVGLCNDVDEVNSKIELILKKLGYKYEKVYKKPRKQQYPEYVKPKLTKIGKPDAQS